ncbi:hypothetical protein FACS189432_07110 [Bacteroidia bacterium]|nr:hypothetical protein FACS189432_07110 [Bacteroidia bacterium]
MKKLFFIVLLSLVFVNTSLAQEIRVGFTAGLDISSYSYDFGPNDNSVLNSRTGMGVGFLVEYPLSKSLFLVPEFQYARRGAKQKEGFETLIIEDEEFHVPYYDYSERINYVQIPVNFLYKIKMSRYVFFNLFAGPYFAYTGSASMKVREASKDIEGKPNLDKEGNFIYHDVSSGIEIGSGENQYKKFDAGLNFGVGYEYYDWIIRLQYNAGLVNMDNRSNVSIKNRNIGISIGYLY